MEAVVATRNAPMPLLDPEMIMVLPVQSTSGTVAVVRKLPLLPLCVCALTQR